VAHLPYRGERGIIGAVGLVVGRTWPLDGISGRLRILIHSLDVAGYTPTGRVQSYSGADPNWTVTLGTLYSPSGETEASYFRVGDRVRLVEWDAAAPAEVLATITAIVGNDVSITTDAVWTPGTKTWNLKYADAADVDANGRAEQFAYGYVAGADLKVTATVAARRFS